MHRTIIRTSERLYAFLLTLYPHSFSQEFGDEMEYVFSESLKDAYRVYGEAGIFTLWARTMLDAGQSLVTQHLDDYKGKNAMNTKPTNFIAQNKNILLIALVTIVILLVPLIGMQFSDDVRWGVFDFVIAGGLIFGTGLAYELLTRQTGTFVYRAAVGLALGSAMFLVFTNLAVGLIGNEDNPANLMYYGVLAIGIIGALIARFRPQGMVRVLFAMAIAQALVPMIALAIWQPPVNTPAALFGVVAVLGVNALFVMLFAGSGLLFRRASLAG